MQTRLPGFSVSSDCKSAGTGQVVIPLKSGIQSKRQIRLTTMAAFWIPFFSGMTACTERQKAMR